MRIVTLALLGAALLLAQDETQEKTTKQPKRTDPRPPASPASAVLPEVPKGAEEVEPNLYRYTDAQGKTWMYRKMPFGISKWEDKPAPAKKTVADTPVPVTVTDLGDKVQFDKQTPFGNSRTVRKKTELTDEEKALIQRDEARRAASANKTPEKTTEKK